MLHYVTSLPEKVTMEVFRGFVKRNLEGEDIAAWLLTAISSSPSFTSTFIAATYYTIPVKTHNPLLFLPARVCLEVIRNLIICHSLTDLIQDQRARGKKWSCFSKLGSCQIHQKSHFSFLPSLLLQSAVRTCQRHPSFCHRRFYSNLKFALAQQPVAKHFRAKYIKLCDSLPEVLFVHFSNSGSIQFSHKFWATLNFQIISELI